MKRGWLWNVRPTLVVRDNGRYVVSFECALTLILHDSGSADQSLLFNSISGSLVVRNRNGALGPGGREFESRRPDFAFFAHFRI